MIFFVFLLFVFVTPKSVSQGKADLIFVGGGSYLQQNLIDPTQNKNVNVNSFYLGKYEVSNAQFCEFLNSKKNQQEIISELIDIQNKLSQINFRRGKYVVKSKYNNHPVTLITWYGAVAYCNWKGGRLPTTEEWQFAALGGRDSNGYTYSGSNDIDEVAVYHERTIKHRRSGSYKPRDIYTNKSGSKTPNELGIHDMSGNVFEWSSEKVGKLTGYRHGAGWDTPALFSFEVFGVKLTTLRSNALSNTGFRICYDQLPESF